MNEYTTQPVRIRLSIEVRNDTTITDLNKAAQAASDAVKESLGALYMGFAPEKIYYEACETE